MLCYFPSVGIVAVYLTVTIEIYLKGAMKFQEQSP